MQNPEELKAAFEDANNASGSALKENEKYLDSIQGKLDQFNNAVQTMWSNALNSDLVKGIVEFGTELIKIIDDIGLFKVALIGVGMYLTRGLDWSGMFSKPIQKTVESAQAKLADLKADMDAAVAADTIKKTPQSHQKAEEAKQRYENYKLQVEEIEAEDLLNKKAQERIKLQEELNAAQDKYELGLEKLGGQEQDGTMAIDAWNEMDALQKKIDENGMSIDDANKQMQAFNATVDQTGKKGVASFAKFGNSMKAFIKQLAGIMVQMAAMYAITTALDLLAKGFNALNEWGKGLRESPEEAQEKFEELNNELSQAQSELRNLESELDKTNDRMEELISMGTLSFVEQEELNNLKKQSSELEYQIELAKTLEETLQNAVNLAAINASQKTFNQTSFYSEESKKDRATAAKDTGTSWGQAIGLAGGVALGIGAAILSGGTASAAIPQFALAGAGIGSTLGGFIGGWQGEKNANEAYDSETTVTDVLDNMKNERLKLEKARNAAYAAYVEDPEDKELKTQWEEAQAALGTYDAALAQHIMQMQQYVNSIDPDSLTNPSDKAYYDQMKKWVDTYAVMMGGPNAKASVIESLFGADAQGGFAEAKKAIDEIYAKIAKAKKSGDELAIADALSELEQFKLDDFLNEQEIADLREYGLAVHEVERYFISQKKAAEDALDAIETYDAVKNIQKLTTGVNDLKKAFQELHDEGIVSAETLLGLYDAFGDVDGFKELFDVLSSGTATMEEAQAVAQEFAENYINQVLGTDELDGQSYYTVLTRLQQLGLTNAKDYLDAKIKQDALSKVVSDSVMTTQEKMMLDVLTGAESSGMLFKDAVPLLDKLRDKSELTSDDIIKQLEEEYGIKLDGENDMLLIEKAITVEKLKQEAIEMQNAKTAYDNAVDARQQIIDNNEIYQAKFDELYGHLPDDIYDINYELGVPADPIYGYLKAQIVDVPDISVDIVTQIDVDEANSAVDAAIAEYQAELDKHGLTAELDLINPNDYIDDIQDIFDTLSNAVKEFNENGYMSVDTAQQLLNFDAQDSKYLALLTDENGQLQLTKESLMEVAQIRTMDLGIKQATNVIDAMRNALEADEIEKAKELTNVNYGLTMSTWDLVEAQAAQVSVMMADKGMTQDEIDSFTNQIKAIQNITDNAINNMPNALSSAGNTATGEMEDAFQKLMDYYDNRIDANQAKYDQIQNDIDWLESQGKMADAGYYRDQLALMTEGEDSKEAFLEAKLQSAKDRLEELEAAGKRGSDEWWDAAQIYNETLSELDEVRDTVLELQDAIGEIEWSKFDEFNNRLDDLASKLGTIRDLIAPDGEEDWFDDEGNWTEKGVSALGTYVQELELYKQGLTKATAAYNDFIYEKDESGNFITDGDGELVARAYTGNESWYAENYGVHSEQEYYEYLQKLSDEQYNYAESVSDTEQDIAGMWESQVDAVEEYMDTLVEAYSEYIDNVKEALDAERD